MFRLAKSILKQPQQWQQQIHGDQGVEVPQMILRRGGKEIFHRFQRPVILHHRRLQQDVYGRPEEQRHRHPGDSPSADHGQGERILSRQQQRPGNHQENRHRKPSGPVAVDRLTVEISAPTAESRERKNRGQIPDTSCKIDVLMVESFK